MSDTDPESTEQTTASLVCVWCGLAVLLAGCWITHSDAPRSCEHETIDGKR